MQGRPVGRTAAGGGGGGAGNFAAISERRESMVPMVAGWWEAGRGSGLSDEAAEDACDCDGFGGHDDVAVGWVGGAEADERAFREDAFEGGFAVVADADGGDGTVGDWDAWAEEDEVAVEDAVAGHGIAAYFEEEIAAAVREEFGWGEEFRGFEGFAERAGWDASEQGDGGGRGISRGQAEAAGLAWVAEEGTLLDEGVDVEGGGARAGEAEVGGDFADAGWGFSEGFALLEVVEQLLLAVCERFRFHVYKCIHARASVKCGSGVRGWVIRGKEVASGGTGGRLRA